MEIPSLFQLEIIAKLHSSPFLRVTFATLPHNGRDGLRAVPKFLPGNPSRSWQIKRGVWSSELGARVPNSVFCLLSSVFRILNSVFWFTAGTQLPPQPTTALLEDGHPLCFFYSTLRMAGSDNAMNFLTLFRRPMRSAQVLSRQSCRRKNPITQRGDSWLAIQKC